ILIPSSIWAFWAGLTTGAVTGAVGANGVVTGVAGVSAAAAAGIPAAITQVRKIPAMYMMLFVMGFTLVSLPAGDLLQA
ncbi:MAG: hypothetical protein PHT99_07565, partial [Methanoregula sp.]|nr:hypothetical protein [Methanoregula sp.]